MMGKLESRKMSKNGRYKNTAPRVTLPLFFDNKLDIQSGLMICYDQTGDYFYTKNFHESNIDTYGNFFKDFHQI